MSLSEYLNISDNVSDALENRKPVVALESTIISHGMPYPKNFETAIEVESTVKNYGAVPATIAIIGGIIKIGLNKSELEFLSREKNIHKVSSRDIPTALSLKLNAATTVSATMVCANLASIRIFATGGTGGVHRDVQNTFDISTDLTELARTNVAVVSAGVKSILDIGLTLEYLETMGVPVIGYGTNEFPAFYTRESGFKIDYRLDTPEEIAGMLNIKRELGLDGGILIANPVPDKFSFDKKTIDSAIDAALQKANEKKVKGKDVTPFLLSEIKNITAGKSLDSNIQLVLNNAKLAAQTACCLNQL